MNEFNHMIREIVNEVTMKIALQEYGSEWNAKLNKALRDLEATYVPPRSEDIDFEDMLKLIQLLHGLSDFETFMVGENSKFLTDDGLWRRMGPQYAKFIGNYPSEDQPSTTVRQEENDPMMAVNTSGTPWQESQNEQSSNL